MRVAVLQVLSRNSEVACWVVERPDDERESVKSTLWIALCLVGLVLAHAPSAAARDQIDELFGASTEVTDDDLFAPAPLVDPDSAAAATAGRPVAAPTGSATWDLTPSVQVTPILIDEDARGAAEIPARSPAHKPAPVSAVPEPTAVVLALLALMYFLVFGRRRRV